jgi:hypothetical protein
MQQAAAGGDNISDAVYAELAAKAPDSAALPKVQRSRGTRQAENLENEQLRLASAGMHPTPRHCVGPAQLHSE